MKLLSELTQEQLRYLRQKWSSELIELNREKIRAQRRLDRRLEKQTIDETEVATLSVELERAIALLSHLQTTSAPAELITAQQEVVNKVQKEYDDESNGLNVLTDEEAHIQQLSIEELEQRKEVRQVKITELDVLIAA